MPGWGAHMGGMEEVSLRPCWGADVPTGSPEGGAREGERTGPGEGSAALHTGHLCLQGLLRSGDGPAQQAGPWPSEPPPEELGQETGPRGSAVWRVNPLPSGHCWH